MCQFSGQVVPPSIIILIRAKVTAITEMYYFMLTLLFLYNWCANVHMVCTHVFECIKQK